MADDSEFGGAPGLIQPAPHNVADSAREQAFLERAVDPWQDQSGVEGVYALVLAGKYPSVPPALPTEISPLQPLVDFVASSNNGSTFTFVGLGNIDLRTARLKWSESPSMMPHTFGPEKEYGRQAFPIVTLEMGSVAPGTYFYQVLMNGIQVTEVFTAVIDV